MGSLNVSISLPSSTQEFMVKLEAVSKSGKKGKREAENEIVKAVSAKKQKKDAQSKSKKKAPKTPATPETSGSKTLVAGNLSFKIEQNDVEEFFKNVGQVVDVRFAKDSEGKFWGFGHVEFATAEEAQKALELNGCDLCGRPVKLYLS